MKFLGKILELASVFAYIAWTLFCRFATAGEKVDDLIFLLAIFVCVIIYGLGMIISRKPRK